MLGGFNMFQHVSTCFNMFQAISKQTSQTVQFSTQVTGNHHLNKHLYHPWNSILRPRPRYQVSAEIIEFSWSATDEDDVNHQRDDLTKFAGLKGKQCDDRSMRTQDLHHSCHSSCRYGVSKNAVDLVYISFPISKLFFLGGIWYPWYPVFLEKIIELQWNPMSVTRSRLGRQRRNVLHHNISIAFHIHLTLAIRPVPQKGIVTPRSGAAKETGKLHRYWKLSCFANSWHCSRVYVAMLQF